MTGHATGAASAPREGRDHIPSQPSSRSADYYSLPRFAVADVPGCEVLLAFIFYFLFFRGLFASFRVSLNGKYDTAMPNAGL